MLATFFSTDGKRKIGRRRGQLLARWRANRKIFII
jgi:hypothetical protein